VRAWRASGLPVGYTVDAGANVHVFCLSEQAEEVKIRLSELPGVSEVLVAKVGGPARVV
jgi:mevalonate pyrophosphate decarboxylase